MSPFLDRKEAAAYCGLTEAAFRALLGHGTGPVFFRPSARKLLFQTSDLDAWLASWQRVQPPTKDAG